MPRTLEIHHIDVGQGESTLIVVKNNGAIEKTALIDGGVSTSAANTVHNYLVSKGVNAPDLVIATHYDKDHFRGLRFLLARNVNNYNTARVYDRGEQATRDRFADDEYLRYVAAINSRGTRNRLTSNVGINQTPDWLIGQELLWRQANGNAQPIPANAPTLTCIAANQYVRSGANNTFVFGGLGDIENKMSLAFALRFNNFLYYTGGDVESDYETAIATHLLTLQNHVCAFKASHHGAETATAASFLTNIKSRAAFISCGNWNGYGHPKPRVIADLMADATIQKYYLTACGDNLPRADIPACDDPPKSQYGLRGRVAGDDTHPGDITLVIAEAQSAANPVVFNVEFWEQNHPNGPRNHTINHTC